MTHTLALEIVLDSISVMVGDVDDVHAARYRAISKDRHAPNLNWTRRMTEVKQQDYKENLFYYTCIKAIFNFLLKQGDKSKFTKTSWHWI